MKNKTLKARGKLLLGSAIATAIAVSAIYAAASGAPATQPVGPDPLAPQITAPAPSQKSGLVPVPYRIVIPPPVVSHDPRPLAKDSAHRIALRPAVDVPPLADAAIVAPGHAEIPAGPTIRIASSDVAAPPVGTIAEKPDSARATLQTDPGAGMVRPGALLLTPPPRTNPPAPQLLIIPDPSHQIGQVPPFTPRVEDPPAINIDRPGPTTLPVTK